MADYTHVYAVARGQWYVSSAWAPEIAQIGMRIGAWPSPTSPDPVADLPVRTCAVTTETHSETLFDVFQGFEGTGGGLGSSAWGYADQLDVATAFRSYLNTIKNQQTGKLSWTDIRVAPIGPDGSAAAGTSVFTLKSPIVGGKSDDPLPPQNAIAMSWLRRIPGRRGRGRMFVPGLTKQAVTSSALLDATTQTGVRDAGKALDTAVKAVGSVSDWEYRIVVCSAKSVGYVLPNQVRVGDEIDTQRSRRNQRGEVYSSVDLT